MSVNGVVFFAKDVEHDFHRGIVFALPTTDSFNSNFCGSFRREAEYTCRNAAECDACDAVFGGKIQTTPVARSEQFAIAFSERSRDNRPDRMQYKFAGQVEGGRNFCGARRLFVTLLLHDFGTGVAQLDSGKSVDTVVDAAMAWLVASRHAAVCRIYNRVHFERRDVAAPQINLFRFVTRERGELCNIGKTTLLIAFLQVFILNAQKFGGQGSRQPHVHQRT